MKIMIILAIYFLLSGPAFGAEFKIHSSEGTQVVAVPHQETQEPSENWVKIGEETISQSPNTGSRNGTSRPRVGKGTSSQSSEPSTWQPNGQK